MKTTIGAILKLMFHSLFVSAGLRIRVDMSHFSEETFIHLKHFCRYKMGFRHFPNIFNEIDKLGKLNTYVDCKLVFSDGSLMVHFAKLLAAQI